MIDLVLLAFWLIGILVIADSTLQLVTAAGVWVRRVLGTVTKNTDQG